MRLWRQADGRQLGQLTPAAGGDPQLNQRPGRLGEQLVQPVAELAGPPVRRLDPVETPWAEPASSSAPTSTWVKYRPKAF